jgi:hypothetical protein
MDSVVRELRSSLHFNDYVLRETYNRKYVHLRRIENTPTDAHLISLILKYLVKEGSEWDRLHDITKIEYAARLSYLMEADTGKFAMWAGTLFYIVAIALILIITVIQTLSVLTTAGWCLTALPRWLERI